MGASPELGRPAAVQILANSRQAWIAYIDNSSRAWAPTGEQVAVSTVARPALNPSNWEVGQ